MPPPDTTPPYPAGTPRAQLCRTGRRPFAGKRRKAVSYDLHTLTPAARSLAKTLAAAATRIESEDHARQAEAAHAVA